MWILESVQGFILQGNPSDIDHLVGHLECRERREVIQFKCDAVELVVLQLEYSCAKANCILDTSCGLKSILYEVLGNGILHGILLYFYFLYVLHFLAMQIILRCCWLAAFLSLNTQGVFSRWQSTEIMKMAQLDDPRMLPNLAL